jgi:hypothetical protein
VFLNYNFIIGINYQSSGQKNDIKALIAKQQLRKKRRSQRFSAKCQQRKNPKLNASVEIKTSRSRVAALQQRPN